MSKKQRLATEDGRSGRRGEDRSLPGRGLTMILRDMTGRREGEGGREGYAARLNELFEVSREVLGATSLPEFMERIVEAARKVTGARLGVCGHGLRKGTFETGAVVGPGLARPVALKDGFRVERKGLHRELLDGRNTIRASNRELTGCADWWGLPSPRARSRGLLGARLVGQDGRPGGMILVSDKVVGEFTGQDEALLGQLAALCSAGLQQLEARELARVRAERLAAVFSAMTDGMVIFNAAGVAIQANRAALEMLGFNPVNRRPERYARRLGFTHPDGRPITPDELPSRQALRGRIVLGERIKYAGADGRRRMVSVSAAPLGTPSQVRGAVVVWHDQTEGEILMQEVAAERDKLERRVEERTAALRQTVAMLRESEERYRTLFETAPLGLALTTFEGGLLEANPSLRAMLGLTQGEAKKKRAEELYARAGELERLLAALRRAGTVGEIETVFKGKGGRLFPALLRASRFDLHGRQILLTIVQDITDRKRAEKRMLGVTRLLELFATTACRSDYLSAVVDLLKEWSGCQAVGIRLADPHGHLCYVASRGFSRTFLRREAQIAKAASRGVCVQALEKVRGHGARLWHGRSHAVVIDEASRVLEKRAGAPYQAGPPCVAEGFESIAHVSIRFRGKFLGSIDLADRRKGWFRPEIMEFMTSVAPIMGEALHRFEVEASLSESEARFRSMFEKHQAIMILTDPVSGQIVDANPAACAFYGTTRERLRGLNLVELGLLTPGAMGRRRRHPLPDWMEAATSLTKGGSRTVEVYSTAISLQRRRLVFSIMHDVTERKVLERQIVGISEAERQRIGRDLHDSLGGHLTGLALLTRALAQTLRAKHGLEVSEIDEIVDGMSAAVGLTREISHGLCPVSSGERGLVTGLQEFVVGIRRRAGIDCRLRVDGDVRVRDAVVSSHLFRIVEEAVQNALRHARAKHIEVRLRRTEAGVFLAIRNDGRPLPENLGPARGLGLRTMRYRADMIGARLELRPLARGGTMVSCLVPARACLSGGTPSLRPAKGQS